MAGFPDITVRHPRAHDLVDDPVEVCGVATGFEGEVSARVRDGNGRELVEESVRAGGTGIWGNFHHRLGLGAVPSTPQGTLEVFEYSAEDGSELNKRVVRVVFGRALVDPYHGFGQHTVVRGETLSAIAESWYGEGRHFRRIFEANRDQLNDPDHISVGQVLRIPQ